MTEIEIKAKQISMICKKTTAGATLDDILKIGLTASKHQATLVFLLSEAVSAKECSEVFFLSRIKEEQIEFDLKAEDFEIFEEAYKLIGGDNVCS